MVQIRPVIAKMATYICIYVIQKHPECKKGAAKNLKKARMKKK